MSRSSWIFRGIGSLVVLVVFFFGFLFFRGCESSQTSATADKDPRDKVIEELLERIDILEKKKIPAPVAVLPGSPSPMEKFGEAVLDAAKSGTLYTGDAATKHIEGENKVKELQEHGRLLVISAEQKEQEALRRLAEAQEQKKLLAEISELEYKIKLQERNYRVCLERAQATNNKYVQKQAEKDMLIEKRKLDQLKNKMSELKK